jgi:hypothetical protein
VLLYDRSHISFDILDYLAEHPDAQDTADGIAQWWILERCVKRHAPLVNEAIQYLVERGFIVGRMAKDSQIHYRINPRKAEEISLLLEQNIGQREQ